MRLTSSCTDQNLYSVLIDECKSFIARSWSIQVIHIFRESNQAAYKLDSLALSLPHGYRAGNLGELDSNGPRAIRTKFYSGQCLVSPVLSYSGKNRSK